MRLRACVVAMVVLVGITSIPAEERPPAPQEEPTFRSGVDLAQIDVMVTDADGNPVSGLTAADFELLENGVPREISTFEAVDFPVQTRDEVGESVSASDVRSNDVPPGRIYMFALDEVAPCNALRTRHFLREFFDRYFGPHDMAAVALVGTGLATDGQDFTSDRRLLLAAIDKFSGGFYPGCPGIHPPPGSLRSGRSQQLAGLRVLTETMARIPGRRKTMLLFTQSIDVNMFDVVDYNGGLLGLAGEDAHAVLRAATRGNVVIHPIDPTGLTPEHLPVATLASLSAMAHATGGVALYNSNSFLQTFERIVRESSTYYLLGFDSGHARDDGRYVRVDVRVKRPGWKVHARDGYVAASRDERRAEREARGDDSPVVRALASSMAVSGVTVRAFAAAYRGTKDRADVELAVEVDARTLDLVERNGRLTGPLELRYVVTTDRDKSYPQSSYTTMLDLEPGAASGFVRIVTQLELPEGRYQIRIAAGTESRAGSVIYDLDVPGFDRGPLAMSDVSLTSRSATDTVTLRGVQPSEGRHKTKRCRPPLCPDDFLTTRTALTDWSAGPDGKTRHWPEPLTAKRDFAPGDTVVLFTEVYDNEKRRRNDPPRALELTVVLRDGNGMVIDTVQETRLSSRGDAHAFTVRLPLENVEPGSYEIAVESGADDDTTSSRPIPIRVLDSAR